MVKTFLGEATRHVRSLHSSQREPQLELLRPCKTMTRLEGGTTLADGWLVLDGMSLDLSKFESVPKVEGL